MALEGYLEDLEIRDILQILSLSKKTGTLTLRSSHGEGLVCIMEGQIIRATSSFFPETLGQLLRKDKITTESQVDKALKIQKSLDHHQPLGQILIENFQITSASIEQVVARQIEKIIFNFFSWNVGTFSFRLEEIVNFGSALLNPLDFMLEKGLSSQRLILKEEQSGENEVPDDDQIDRKLAELEDQQSRQGLGLLRGMLAELEHPELGGGIILLILRYASEIMNRAIVFDVRGNQLVGVGQFGLSNLNIEADNLVRQMTLHIDAGSIFAQVMKDKIAVRSALKKTLAEESLRSFLNGTPDDIFLGPLVSDGKVVALLYGDNYLSGHPIREANAFEVFLSQAGLAMEQALGSSDLS